jgi:hypothetical protein
MRLIRYLPFLLIMTASSLAQAAPQYSWNISVGTGVGYYGRPYLGPYYPQPFYGRHYNPYYRTYYSPPPVYYPVPYYLGPAALPLISQSQPPVWYYCASQQQYYPIASSCNESWKVVPAISPQSTSPYHTSTNH